MQCHSPHFEESHHDWFHFAFIYLQIHCCAHIERILLQVQFVTAGIGYRRYLFIWDKSGSASLTEKKKRDKDQDLNV